MAAVCLKCRRFDSFEYQTLIIVSSYSLSYTIYISLNECWISANILSANVVGHRFEVMTQQVVHSAYESLICFFISTLHRTDIETRATLGSLKSFLFIFHKLPAPYEVARSLQQVCTSFANFFTLSCQRMKSEDFRRSLSKYVNRSSMGVFFSFHEMHLMVLKSYWNSHYDSTCFYRVKSIALIF